MGTAIRRHGSDQAVMEYLSDVVVRERSVFDGAPNAIRWTKRMAGPSN